MFGPGLGGWLGDYGMHVPFLVSAGLSALSMVCTYTILPRELPPQEAAPATAGDAALPAGRRPGAFAFSTYAEFFRRPGLASVYVRFFLFTFAFSAFTSGFALFAEQRFGWNARDTGYLFTYAGFVGIILQGGLIGRLVKRYGEVSLGIIAFAAAVIGYIMLGFAETVAMLVIVATVNGFGNGVLRPVLTSQITQKVGRHEQGVALGISGSLSSLAMTMAPPCGGIMLDHHETFLWAMVPSGVAVIGLVAALLASYSPRHES